MIVFKHYFKIVKQFIPMILMYTFIFTFFAVVAVSTNSEGGAFNTAKPKIYVSNQDTHSELTKTFVNYTKKNATIVPLQDNDEALKDALFYREVDYIMIIPNGFGASVMKGNPLPIETNKVPDSYNSTYTEMLLNRFLNTASIYAKTGMSEKNIASNIMKDMKEQTKVTLLKSNQNELEKVTYFYNFSNYTILAISIFIIGMLITIFNDSNIKKRNLVSMVSYKSINGQLFLGNAVMAFLIWLLYGMISVILYKEVMFTMNGLLFLINSLIFSFMALSLGFLIGNLVKNKEAQSGIVNVFALGTSFLCGAFVPQEFLGASVLSIAKFLPSYWFIKNNNDIAILSNYDFQNLKPIIIAMFIVLLFGIAFFLLTNLVTRMRRKTV